MVGDTIQFGGLDWIVLARDGGRALILSKNVLERRAFDAEGNNWESSDLREYLNGPFYHSTFSGSERARIVETNLFNESGNTDDKVFLLSRGDVYVHMGDSAHVNIVAARAATGLDGSPRWWWTRSRGRLYGTVCGVGLGGNVYVDGSRVSAVTGGVRPALWLDL